MATIESKDETVAGVFRDFYVVPNYQREYVWGEGEVDQLLRDIRTEQAERADSEYFIGSIVVCPRDDGAFDLIDGQQRMTTLFVILCAIRDRLAMLGDTGNAGLRKLIAETTTNKAGDDEFRARLEPQYDDAGDVFVRLVNDTPLAANGTRSMENVAAVYRAAQDFLKEEFQDNQAEVKAFYGYLLNGVKLIRIRTDSVARALKIFETINDRGKSLDAMDLLKNLLFMKIDPKKFDRLKERWKKLTDALYKADEKPLRFLRYYIFATYGATQIWENKLYEWFTKNEQLVGFSRDPIAFVDRLQDALNAYLCFLKGQDRTGKSSPAIEPILMLARKSTRQHLILLLAGRDLPIDVFDALCIDTEKLLFVYLVTRRTKVDFETFFPEWASELFAVQTIVDYEAFAERTLRKRLRELAARFHREFAVLDGSTMPRYQLRYLLGKLTQHVDQSAYGRSARANLQSQYCDGANVDIEHILPQSPDEAVRAEFGEGADNPALLWSIGNLVLAEKSINTSLGRRVFSYKRTIYPKSQFLLTRVLGEKPDIGRTAIDRAVAAMTPFETWTRASIVQRSKWLSQLAAETWSVPMIEEMSEQTVEPA